MKRICWNFQYLNPGYQPTNQSAVPDNFHLWREPLLSRSVQLRIELHRQNVAAFEQAVIDFSTPGHPKYGQRMKRKQIKSMLRPTNAAINGVLGWLKSEGVPNSDLLHESDWIHFNITVSKAEKMLDTKFAWYRNDINGAVKLRTLGYSVPTKIMETYWHDPANDPIWINSSTTVNYYRLWIHVQKSRSAIENGFLPDL